MFRPWPESVLSARDATAANRGREMIGEEEKGEEEEGEKEKERN